MELSGATVLSSALPTTVSSIQGGATAALDSAVGRASDVVQVHGSSSWLGLFARLILWILQTVSSLLYFVIKLATISVPTTLFTVFSTSLTVTMNATTL
jgi:lysophospholipid hydrolase